MKVTGLVPILNVSSVPDSVAWFEKLGWKRGFTWNSGGMMEGALHNEAGPADFASVCNGDYEIFLCKDGQGSRPGPVQGSTINEDNGGVWMSLWLESPAAVDEMYRLAQQAGMTIGLPPENKPWNVREFHLCHPDGHTFRVSAGIGEG